MVTANGPTLPKFPFDDATLPPSAGPRVLVLGAGVAGLTAAHELAVRGFAVTVLEAHPTLVGGLARTQYGERPVGAAPSYNEITEANVAFDDATKESGSAGRAYLPGEHGYRFFPAFYRHLTDTMSRTPRVDEPQGGVGALELGGRSLADNLIATRVVGYAGGPTPGGAPVRVRRFSSEAVNLETFSSFVRDFMASASLTASDLEKLQLALVQYVTSSAPRRALLERQSWWDFIHGDDLSAPARAWLDKSPEALVAMSAKQSDARTYGSVAVQMMLDQMGDGSHTDRTLDGPTSEAWLEPWKLFLHARLGVTFVMGCSVSRLHVDAAGALDRVEVEYDGGTHHVHVGTQVAYVVCALPLEHVGSVLPSYTGAVAANGNEDLKRLVAFAEASMLPSTTAAGDPAPTASEKRGFGRQAGLQFYLKERLHFLRGHLYCENTQWGLTAISQSQFWREDIRHELRDVGTVLSVDIGVWDAPGGPANAPTTSASQMTSGLDIAKEVWRQLSDAVGPGAVTDDGTEREIVPRAKLPNAPWAWHLDSGLFEGTKVIGGLLLINRPGDYALRPGQIDDPTKGYDLVLGNRLVFAGPHMQTFTRLTTMEAANESARHAVNGVLKHVRYAGDGCAIYPIERAELDETASLKRLDEELLTRWQLPHAAELLRARQWLGLFNGLV